MTINDTTALNCFFDVDFTPGVALPVVSDTAFRKPDYIEVMLLSGMLAKHLELAFKDSFKGQKQIHLAPEKGNGLPNVCC